VTSCILPSLLSTYSEELSVPLLASTDAVSLMTYVSVTSVMSAQTAQLQQICPLLRSLNLIH